MRQAAAVASSMARRHPVIRAFARLNMRLNTVLRADLYRGLGFLLGSGQGEMDALRSMLLSEGREGLLPSTWQVAIPEFLYRLDSSGESWDRILSDWVPTREALAFSSGAALSAKRLEDLADDIDRRAAIMCSARSAALPLGFAVLFVAATLYGLGAYLFPEFERIGIQDWTGAIASLRNFSIWFAANWLFLSIVLTAAAVLYVLALPRLTGPLRGPFDLLPGTGIYSLAVGLDWLSVMANLMQAHVGHLEACRLIRPYASPYLRVRLDAVVARPNMTLSDALATTDDAWPSRRIVRLLAIINHSDEPFVAIRKVIDQEIGALDRRIRAATEIVHAMTQLVMIAFIVFLLLLTFQLSSQPFV